MKADNEGGKIQEPISNIDRLIHEPSRLTVMAHLYVVENADFLFLIRQTGMTWGNLSVHISKLEAAGYLLDGTKDDTRE
jgi:DNA-binding transcriptional ArsR family regulator